MIPVGDAPLVIVGELNPYGADPRHALYDRPERASGHRLRTLIMGVPRRVYLSFARYNLCTGKWSTPAARERAQEIREALPPGVPVLLLGRKVAGAFHTFPLAPCSSALRPGARDSINRFVAIPHPSSRNGEWNDPGAPSRVRALLELSVPSVAWGSLDVDAAHQDALDAAARR